MPDARNSEQVRLSIKANLDAFIVLVVRGLTARYGEQLCI